MPEKLDEGILYYRAKGDATGAVVVGAILVAFAWIVLTRDGLGGIPFSKDLVAMSTYLALPLGVVLFLANLPHVLARGPTMAAGEGGITILFTPRPVGLIRWTAINGFLSFKHQGKWYLGIVLEDPEETLMPYKGTLAPVVARFGPREAHLKIHGKMLDDEMQAIVADLEEMRRVRSWRAA
jgi:hypothetical protein